MAISDVLGERRTVDVAAGTLEYRVRGSGPPVVLAHGAGMNGDLWRHVVPALAADHTCYSLDLPLGGHSIALDGEQDLSLFGAADILGDAVEALGLAGATLIANDTGGALAQGLVGRRPHLLGRLVLTSCDAFGNYPPRAVAYLKVVSRIPAALWLLAKLMRFKAIQRLPIAYGWATREPMPPPIMASYLAGLRFDAGVRRDFARLLTLARKRDSEEASASVTRFGGPAIVVWGAEDKFFPREHGQRLAGLLPRGRFELVADARSFIPEDNPAALVAVIRAFLEEADA